MTCSFHILSSVLVLFLHISKSSMLNMITQQEKERYGNPTLPATFSPASPVALLVIQLVRNLPAMQETQVQFPGLEDLLENGMATHSSILGHGEPHGQRLASYSPWGHKESDTTK